MLTRLAVLTLSSFRSGKSLASVLFNALAPSGFRGSLRTHLSALRCGLPQDRGTGAHEVDKMSKQLNKFKEKNRTAQKRYRERQKVWFHFHVQS